MSTLPHLIPMRPSRRLRRERRRRAWVLLAFGVLVAALVWWEGSGVMLVPVSDNQGPGQSQHK